MIPAPSHVDQVRVNTATTGAGTVTIGAALSGCRTFAGASVPNGATVHYGIQDGAQSETGYGVFNSGAGTMTRNLISSTTGSLLNLSGSAVISIDALAVDFFGDQRMDVPRSVRLARQANAFTMS